jgi:hypothetical protein
LSNIARFSEPRELCYYLLCALLHKRRRYRIQ